MKLAMTFPRQPSRTMIACNFCRGRKIRCSGIEKLKGDKCNNCRRRGQECIFQPVTPGARLLPAADHVHGSLQSWAPNVSTRHGLRAYTELSLGTASSSQGDVSASGMRSLTPARTLPAETLPGEARTDSISCPSKQALVHFAMDALRSCGQNTFLQNERPAARGPVAFDPVRSAAREAYEAGKGRLC